MNKHVIFILDRSGSMASIKPDVIGGFNTYVKDLRADSPEATFQLVQFDTQALDIPAATKARAIVDLNESTYQPRGGTPLLDAVGTVVSTSLDNADTAYLVVILTDGQENESKTWNLARLKSLIEQKQATNRWTFMYLGSNQDAWAEAGAWGIPAGSTITINNTGASAARAFTTTATATQGWSNRVDLGIASMDSSFADVTCADCQQVIAGGVTHMCPKSGRIGQGKTFAGTP